MSEVSKKVSVPIRAEQYEMLKKIKDKLGTSSLEEALEFLIFNYYQKMT